MEKGVKAKIPKIIQTRQNCTFHAIRNNVPIKNIPKTNDARIIDTFCP